MLYNAYGWSFNEPAGFIGEVIAERMDSNTSFATFPWVFAQYHGSETDHAGMAMVLAGHIETVMGWVPVAQDVMSGFGRNGNEPVVLGNLYCARGTDYLLVGGILPEVSW